MLDPSDRDTGVTMYADYENSPDSGTPIELYDFIQGVNRWSYVSGDVGEITRMGATYTPFPLDRNRIKQTTDIFKDSLTIKFPLSDPFAAQYLGYAPDEVTTLTILRGHLEDPDEEYITYWKGRVAGASASGNTIDVECESVFTSIRRPGLRARYERNCIHTLYQSACGVNREAFKHTGAVLSQSGLNITVAGASLQADGFYTGGILVTPDGFNRFITAHTGDLITLSRPVQTNMNGLDINVYPGCDHLKSTCINKFNNLPNFGGCPYIPTRNPFDGSSII